MLIRDSYRAKIDLGDISSSNEPLETKGLEHLRKYPDMLEAYENFSKIFDIPLNRFILANGGENAVKNTLLALRPKKMFYSYPTWGMLDVFCEALNIEPVRVPFKIKTSSKEIFEDLYAYERLDFDCFYSCGSVNNYFRYVSIEPRAFPTKSDVIQISDQTYSELDYIKNQVEHQSCSTVIVGSFDKLVGCGLRLGFAIFPSYMNDRFQLQREQFLNYEAIQFLKNFNEYNLKSNYRFEKLQEYLKTDDFYLENKKLVQIVHPNFCTYFGKLEHKGAKHFQVGNQWFTRIGYK